MDECSVATFEISTLLIGLSSQRRATSPGASGAGCRLNLHTVIHQDKGMRGQNGSMASARVGYLLGPHLTAQVYCQQILFRAPQGFQIPQLPACAGRG